MSTPQSQPAPPANQQTPANVPPSAPTPTEEIGYAVSIKNYIVWVNGLPNIRLNEIVTTGDNAKGVVISIAEDLVGVLMLDEAAIKPKQDFKRTQQQLSIKVGTQLLGRMINPLSQPLDGKGMITIKDEPVTIEQAPRSIKSRERITDQFETGLSLVDMLVPVAKGQRELVLGDAHSGKTGFLLDTVINQRGRKIICVYAVIGKPINEISNVVKALEANKALEYTVVVSTSSSDKPPLIYLTPSVATTIAEYFQKRGNDVLMVLDDMGIHAKFYREISLSLGRPPGRESYPGDIFYQHAKLIERAGRFKKEYGGGSITALPVIETNLDDFSSFMTTNLMGMTDGHLLFSATRYHQGYRPSVDISLSVSRVGRQTQNLAQKGLADRIKALLSEANRLAAYSRFGSEISPQTLFTLKQGKQMEAILKQLPLNKIPILVQMILIGLIFTPFLQQKDEKFVEENKNTIVQYLTNKFNLSNYAKTVATFKDDEQFINSLSSLIPELEKITNAQVQAQVK